MNSASILSNAVSGMYASSLQPQATANNIVNAGLSTHKEVQAGTGVSAANTIPNNRRNIKDITPNIVNEMMNLIRVQHTYTANAKVIETSEELIGSLLDIVV